MNLLTAMLVLSLAAPPTGARAVDTDSLPDLRAFLMAECQKHFDARRALVGRLKTSAEIQTRQKALRSKFIEALGGFPERTPLNARVVGTIKANGYTIEKVIYESRPNHHVTANFYLPAGKGPFPGVLMPIGHSVNGKAAEYVQRGCILLAMNGIAALAYDPIGQGERRQLLNDKGLAVVPGTTTEHTLVGVGALLVGSSTATYRIWDGLRSLDYLASRSEIDAKKIGCTGCSGGGTLTSYLMALDDRIAAAAPSCYITTLERLFATLGPQDAEQNITGQVAFGMDHADYITLRATRPTLVCAATGDFFDIQGTWTAFREAKRLYTLMGHPERLDILESNTKHGYPREHREGMARWMLRWLAGQDRAIVENEMSLIKDDQLACTRTGQVVDDLKGVSTFGLNIRRAKELATGRPEAKPDAIARALGLTLPVAAAKVTNDGTTFNYQTEAGLTVRGRLTDGKGPLVIIVHEDGLEAGDKALEKSDRRRLALEVRGWGKPKAAGYFGADMRESFLALHLNRPLLGQRVHDLLAVIAQRDENVELIGIGKGAQVVLHAAALSSRVQSVRLERPLVSWTNVVETPLAVDQLTQVVPGVLTVYDLPELAASLAPRRLEIVSPINAVGQTLDADAAKAAYQKVAAAYVERKLAKSFTLDVGR